MSYYDTITFIAQDGSRISVSGLCALSRQYTIVSTALAGRAGSVKEYIQAEDWNIDITIRLQPKEDFEAPKYRDYPHEEMRRLVQFFDKQAKTPYRIQSHYLQLFNIEQVVVQATQITQTTHTNTQELHVSCLSDTPYEINATY